MRTPQEKMERKQVASVKWELRLKQREINKAFFKTPGREALKNRMQEVAKNPVLKKAIQKHDKVLGKKLEGLAKEKGRHYLSPVVIKGLVRANKFRLINMTTYAQVVTKDELIIQLAIAFGFSDDVRIHYDLPLEPEVDQKTEMKFVVRRSPEKSVNYENAVMLGAKLSEVLACDVCVVDYSCVEELYRFDVDRKSASITDRRALQEVIYRINHNVHPNQDVDQNVVSSIQLDQIECKEITENDRWSHEAALVKANQYLDKSCTSLVSSNGLYNVHGLLGAKSDKQAKKREKDDSFVDSSGKKNKDGTEGATTDSSDIDPRVQAVLQTMQEQFRDLPAAEAPAIKQQLIDNINRAAFGQQAGTPVPQVK